MRFTELTGKHAHHAKGVHGQLPNSSAHDSGGTKTFELHLTAEIAREIVIEARERRMHPDDLIALIVTDAVITDAGGN
jgi:hypothetical protein